MDESSSVEALSNPKLIHISPPARPIETPRSSWEFDNLSRPYNFNICALFGNNQAACFERWRIFVRFYDVRIEQNYLIE